MAVSYDCARLRVVMGDNMKGYNKTVIIGRLACEPKLKQVDGHDLASFTICCSTLDTNGKESIEYHRIDALDKQANMCVKNLKKGDLCCIEGTLHSVPRDVNGETKYSQLIRCEMLSLLTPRR
jgi:single-stranded DNA-binding protein